MLPLDPSFSILPPGEPAQGLDRPSQPLRRTVRHLLLIATGLALFFLFTSTLLPRLKEALNQPPMPTTKNSMSQLGLIFKMYANESKGEFYPRLAPNSRIWAPDLSQLYPKYLSDPSVLVARNHPDAEHILESIRAVLDGPNPDYDTAAGLMGLSFAYMGHAVRDETEFECLLEARQTNLLGGPEYVLTLPDGGRVLPFREGVDRALGTDLTVRGASEKLMQDVPVLVETWQWKQRARGHTFSGANILYWDGRVAWVPLGTFPVVPPVMDVLCGLAQETAR